MIELINIHKIYSSAAGEIRALCDIDLQVNIGEIVGVIGKSGAGKSTLIRTVNLLEQPTSGVVRVAGEELTKMSAAQLRSARQQIGMIFQHFNLLSSQTVYENVALPLKLNNLKSSEIEQAVLPLLELTGLTDKKNSYPAQLSGGQKQRVAIARALVNKPKVLLCDEATSSLDPHTTQSILTLLKEINKRLNLTILLISHEMDVVKSICDQVAVIDHGKIVEKNNIVELFTKPQSPITRHFVASSLKHELPEILQQRISQQITTNSFPVIRIYFKGHAASEPLIAHLIQKIGLELNILQANLEFIQNYTIGIMVAAVLDNQQHLQLGIDYLKQQSVDVEIIGYISNTNY